MAVDVYIGSVETVIESSQAGGRQRHQELAEMKSLLKRELAIDQLDDERRKRDSTVELRNFGRRN